jgi:hypothetical protein
MRYTGNKMSNRKYGTRYNTTSFIDKAREIHPNQYNYSLVEYKNSFTKIKIICPTHGEFEQRPCDHINQKQGCPKCSHNFSWTHLQYSLKSKDLYNDKFEIISEYSGMKHPIMLRCKEHGNFALKRAEKHLDKSGGCPTCWYLGRLKNLKPGNISKVEQKWLDSLSVPLRQYKLTIEGKTFLVDGFDPATNTVYECYGSFWHGNPEKYKSMDTNVKIGKTFGQLYKDTIVRENIIKKEHHLITKWV